MSVKILGMTRTCDEGFVLVGGSSYPQGGWDVYALKIDSHGGRVWEMTYGGNGNQYGWSVAEVEDGCYVAIGNDYRGSSEDQAPIHYEKICPIPVLGGGAAWLLALGVLLAAQIRWRLASPQGSA
jgi:hypothetical protein